MHFATGAAAKCSGTVEHMRLHFIARAAGKDVVVEALAAPMGLNDSKSQTASACWAQHFRGNRAGRLLRKHGTTLPADWPRRKKRGRYDAVRKAGVKTRVRSPCDSASGGKGCADGQKGSV